MREYILSSEEARRVDRFTMDEIGIPGIELMQKAGNFVSLKAKLLLKDVPGSRIDIFCGTGNNGGDGFVAACNLWEWGGDINIWIVGDPEKIQGDARHFYQRCREAQLKIKVIREDDELGKLAIIREADLIIDALLGTGFRGDVKGITRDIIALINETELPVLAVDIPSGIRGDTGQVGGLAVQARKTVTMGFLKRGLLFHPGKRYAGEVVLVDLGYPPQAYSVLENETYLIRGVEVERMLPAIDADTYKHRQGKILIFAGSPGMTGAATLSALGAMRAGAGLVVAAVPESLNGIMEIKLTEALTLPLPESKDHSFTPHSLMAAAERIDWSDLIVFGPGVSRRRDVMAFGKKLLSEWKAKPVVVDADGLRIFHQNLELIHTIDDLIITPHLGEFSDLTGIPATEIRQDIIEHAREFVHKHRCTLVLKGAPTIIVAPDLTVAVNSTGNPALASGGTGDVLTGVIAAFRAQGMNSFEAAASAVYIHGLAADEAYEELGIRGFIAGDLLTYIPKCLKKFDRIR